MNAPTNFQTITGTDGKPVFVVMPYADFMRMYSKDEALIPHAVVAATVNQGITPVKAWREHLGLTQMEVARRLDITQPAYAKQENADTLRPATLAKIARALGIGIEQLDF